MARRAPVLAVLVAIAIAVTGACDSNVHVAETVPNDILAFATNQAELVGDATFMGALAVDDLPAYCPGVCDGAPGPGWVVMFEVVRPDGSSDEVRVIFRQDGAMVATQY